jgi:hypothetical protein
MTTSDHNRQGAHPDDNNSVPSVPQGINSNEFREEAQPKQTCHSEWNSPADNEAFRDL